MPLAISNYSQINGVRGVAGNNGANATSTTVVGENGGNGTAAKSALSTFSGQTLLGDAGRDVVQIGRTAEGAAGGSGGIGGNGSSAPGFTTTVNRPTENYFQQDFFAGGTGAGGNGGNGGAGGAATARINNVTLDLGGTPAGFADQVNLNTTARGNDGGHGGAGGTGGYSVGRWFSVSTTTDSFPGGASTTINNRWGVNGGEGGLAGLAGAGGRGQALITDVDVTGSLLSLTIGAAASGGTGGAGGRGGYGGLGGGPGLSQNASNGGRGGDATAQVSGLDVTATAGLMLNLVLTATGGQGGFGAHGAQASQGYESIRETINGETTGMDTTTYGNATNAGRGGAGGAAKAAVVGSTFTGSDAVDSVSIDLRATGGTGRDGGSGGNAVASSGGESNGIISTVVGTSAGANGATGKHGNANAVIQNTLIDLGGGDDSLTLAFYLTGQGKRTITTSGNDFRGGTGTDTLSVWTGNDGKIGITVDTHLGTLKIGGGTGSLISGFESFRGTLGNDRFIDGAGSHRYEGRGGVDSFVFTAGRAGNDTIAGFDANDRITLTGFGAALDSYAEVLAAASNVSGGVRIVTGVDSSVLLAGMTVAQLQADDFLFA
jgi:hypothetical protein